MRTTRLRWRPRQQLGRITERSAPAAITAVCAAVLLCVSSLTACSQSPQNASQTPALRDEEASAEIIISQSLDQYWERAAAANPGLPRPDVDRIRVSEPTEFDQTIASCLQDKGIDATVSASGGVNYTVASKEQEAATLLAHYECVAMYPMDPSYSSPLTSDKLAEIYLYWTDELTPCLNKFGIEVPEPPSLTTFQETYGQSDAWAPYQSVVTSPGLSQEDFDAIAQACPEYSASIRNG